MIPVEKKVPPRTTTACGVAVGSDIYMFGGFKSWHTSSLRTNDLWMLTKSKGSSFNWNIIKPKGEIPSPHEGHSGWEHNGKLWIFGGFKTVSNHVECNNQLMCFDPTDRRWINPQCSGIIPSPRYHHSTTAVRGNVWLYGGKSKTRVILSDLFQLNMDSLIWTKIETDLQKPPGRCLCSLTAVSDNQLILHGGLAIGKHNRSKTSWIFDIFSSSWACIETEDHPRFYHTGTVGFNHSVLIVGGEYAVTDATQRHQSHYNQIQANNPVFSVMLEPKALQKLAMFTVYQHKDELPLERLPKKQTSKLLGNGLMDDNDNDDDDNDDDGDNDNDDDDDDI